jgi:hypothetical protein
LKLGTDELTLEDAVYGYLERSNKKRIVKHVPFYRVDDRCFEAIEMEDGKVVFLTHEGKKYTALPEIDANESLVVRPESYMASPYLFTAKELEEAVPPSLPDLYRRVLEFVRDYFSHPDPRVHKFVAMYILHGYMLLKSNGTAFLWLGGPSVRARARFRSSLRARARLTKLSFDRVNLKGKQQPPKYW